MSDRSAAPTYQDLLNDATKLIHESCDTPRIDAEMLLQHVVQRPLAWLIAYGDTIATADHTRAFYALIQGRQQGQPLAYLIGSRDFWTLTLDVNEHVLIPRPDTETLVEQALARLPKDRRLDALDLGTGSGAIALSIAKERPCAAVLAVDSQSDALSVAKHNAVKNGVNNVKFLHSNWFTQINPEARFDLIVANPPYVALEDPHLQQGDLRYEPETALIAEDRGFSDLKIIIQSAPHYLAAQGWLIVEHGYNQNTEIASLFDAAGFSEIETYKDLNDLPRCTAGQWPHD